MGWNNDGMDPDWKPSSSPVSQVSTIENLTKELAAVKAENAALRAEVEKLSGCSRGRKACDGIIDRLEAERDRLLGVVKVAYGALTRVQSVESTCSTTLDDEKQWWYSCAEVDEIVEEATTALETAVPELGEK